MSHSSLRVQGLAGLLGHGAAQGPLVDGGHTALPWNGEPRQVKPVSERRQLAPGTTARTLGCVVTLILGHGGTMEAEDTGELIWVKAGISDK